MPITLSASRSGCPANFVFQRNPIFPKILRCKNWFRVDYPLRITKAKSFENLRSTHKFYWSSEKSISGFLSSSRIDFSGFAAKAQNPSGASGENDNKLGDKEMEGRGQSSMPERFRYLTKEASEKPVRWPWLIVLVFMLYSWRAVVWELHNWKRMIGAIFQFSGYILKLILAFVFHFIGDPVTSLIRGIETIFYTIGSFYSSVTAYTPIQELATIIILTSAVLVISQATVPDSVSSQPYLLSFSGLIGFAAVQNYVSELCFWTLLMCIFAFSRLIKKRDYVSSALPLAAILAAVGEPWVRAIVMVSYLALAIDHSSKNGVTIKEGEDSRAVYKIPVPLLGAALAIVVRVMAKWARYRHLT